MYNAHRGMMPQHQPPNNRLTELLDQIRAEFDNQAGQAGRDEHQRESFMNQQIREIELIRQKVFELEQTHMSVKADQDRKIDHLQRELDVRGPPHTGPVQPAPPVIGHGPRDLFGQIMAGGGAQGPSALGPPPQEPQQPQGLPAHLTQGAGLNTGPQPSQHPPFSGYPAGTGVNGYQQAPPPTTSPGPKPRVNRGLPGAATPQPIPPVPYPGSPRSHMPTPPPGHRQAPPMPPQHQIPNVGNALAELDVNELPPQFKHVGEDWWAIFNPQVQRRLDVNLVHTLHHKSVVCCVRFSHDGRLVATGCNRAAMIYDVESGAMVADLEDESADKEGDLYIRSVCFSPDGKYLATGAEDKMIRVWDIAAKEIKIHFAGHEQDIYSLDFSRNGRILASGSGDKTVRLWSLDEKRELRNLPIDDGVTTVALSADGRLVAAGSLDRSVRVWDVESGINLDLLDGPDGHQDSVYSVAFSPSGRELVSGSLDRTIKMWQLTPQVVGPQGGVRGPKGTGKCIRTFEGHMDFVLSVALTPDGAWVLSGSKDRGVQFWDPHTGQTQLHLQGHKNSVISVAPSPKGGLFATGSGDMKAKIWRQEELIKRLRTVTSLFVANAENNTPARQGQQGKRSRSCRVDAVDVTADVDVVGETAQAGRRASGEAREDVAAVAASVSASGTVVTRVRARPWLTPGVVWGGGGGSGL